MKLKIPPKVITERKMRSESLGVVVILRAVGNNALSVLAT